MSYIEDLKNTVNLDDLKEVYLNKLLSIDKCAKELNITYNAVINLIKEYNLTRDRKSVKSLSNSKVKNIHFNEVKERLTKEYVYNYYIVEDNSYNDCLKTFNITGWTFDRLLKEYNIKKDKKVSSKKSVITRYEKAGGKDKYNEEQKVKSDQTKIKKYGSLEKFYKERQDKIENTNLTKYGFKYKRTADLVKDHSLKYLEVWKSKEESINYLKSFKDKPTVDVLALNLNCSLNNIYLWIEKYSLGSFIKNTKSRKEEELLNYLKTFNLDIITRDRKVINPLELDIYIPSKKLAIEFNGNYWHANENLKDKFYHFNKSLECEKRGIRLIHIYEYQWKDSNKRDILKSIIKNAIGVNDKIIYARKCEIKYLNKNDVEKFSYLNSLHGHRNASVYLGLFYEHELVQIMSFGKAFFSRDKSIDYECIRSITKLNTTVVGGMNKLFTRFIKDYNPNKILYYVDYNTHVGNSMEKLGFEFQSYSKCGTINISNCKEVTEKFGYVFNRKPSKNKEIQKYINEGKILTLYDCGVKKYIWKKE